MAAEIAAYRIAFWHQIMSEVIFASSRHGQTGLYQQAEAELLQAW